MFIDKVFWNNPFPTIFSTLSETSLLIWNTIDLSATAFSLEKIKMLLYGISMGESTTIVAAYTLYRHLQ